MQRVISVVRCGGEERSNVWLNLGASGVLCKGSVTGLSCSLGCPATVWAGCGANKRLFSGGTTVCVCGDGRVERVRLGSQAVSGKMGRLCPSPVLQAAGAFGEGKPRLELCDEPQRRLRGSGFCLLSCYPFVPFIG